MLQQLGVTEEYSKAEIAFALLKKDHSGLLWRVNEATWEGVTSNTRLRDLLDEETEGGRRVMIPRIPLGKW